MDSYQSTDLMSGVSHAAQEMTVLGVLGAFLCYSGFALAPRSLKPKAMTKPRKAKKSGTSHKNYKTRLVSIKNLQTPFVWVLPMDVLLMLAGQKIGGIFGVDLLGQDPVLMVVVAGIISLLATVFFYSTIKQKKA